MFQKIPPAVDGKAAKWYHSAMQEEETLERERRKALAARRAAGARRLAARTVPGLPVDADASELRNPVPRLDAAIDAMLESLRCERSPFFDAVCAGWDAMFPGLPARPGRYEDRCLYLFVRSPAVNFAVRPKLPAVKRALAKLAGAPKRFDVRLEIRA